MTTHAKIFAVVRKIPKGLVATYGQIAELSGLPGQARLVGYALHTLSGDTRIPWHRVINARGEISLGDLDGAREEQIRRLRAEGIVLYRGRVDFSRFGWMSRVRQKAERKGTGK